MFPRAKDGLRTFSELGVVAPSGAVGLSLAACGEVLRLCAHCPLVEGGMEHMKLHEVGES